MARKTKAEAEITRIELLDAAERLFLAQGVSRTSLQHIAAAAGVTRGAVYWHFKDKSDLFNAMVDRFVLPLEDADTRFDVDDGTPVLPLLRARTLEVFTQIATEPTTQRVLEIVLHKVEAVGELAGIHERRRQSCDGYRQRVERALVRGQQRGEVTSQLPARQLALGWHALVDGLIQAWSLDPQGFRLLEDGAPVLDFHLAGMAARH
jgi:TetR/AcrR family transcriptional regulator, acrAB operon repressor